MSIIYDRALNASVKAKEIILNLGPKLNTFSVFDIKFHSKASKAVSNSSKRTFSLFVYQFRIRCNRSFSNFNSQMSLFVIMQFSKMKKYFFGFCLVLCLGKSLISSLAQVSSITIGKDYLKVWLISMRESKERKTEGVGYPLYDNGMEKGLEK